MKNLNAIVWLYRGETEKYNNLLNLYYLEITQQFSDFVVGIPTFSLTDEKSVNKFIDFQKELQSKKCEDLSSYIEIKDLIKKGYSIIKEYRAEKLECVKNLSKEKIQELFEKTQKTGIYTLGWYKKQIEKECDDFTYRLDTLLQVINDAFWLVEKFGDGVYTDVLGLCKVATIAEIEEKGWSLTPGAYVGVTPVKDDGVDFAKRMAEIHRELLSLQAESNDLMDTISQNMKGMEI